MSHSNKDENKSEGHQVTPKTWCPHLEEVKFDRNWKPDFKVSCSKCDSKEVWVCLTCYQVYCGRHGNKHMLEHYSETKHAMVLSYADLSVWCYACDSYVFNEKLDPVKKAAYLAKFGEEDKST